MAGHRNLRRASSEFLSAGGFLFDAFIGQMLRERYTLPQEVPPDMRYLLTQLDKSAYRASGQGQQQGAEPGPRRTSQLLPGQMFTF
jgi:hypothetical protein